MNRVSRTLVLVLVLSISVLAARAEQEVTLESGATLIGDVTFDGDSIVVDIDGAKQRVPLADVESVTPTGFGAEREARRLLLAALEARQLGGPPREALALLTEAARLEPDNAQIAFWQATTLVDAGRGKAADQTFEAHRATIEGAYPDAVDRLAERIRMRKLLEMLPSEMVERIDQLNAAAAVQPASAAIRPMAVAFRVLDQYKDPVDKAAFQIYASGSDESLEPYADGYFLYTFVRRREESEQPCRLNIAQYGFKSEQHEFRASSAQVAIAGEFQAHRYGEADKRPYRVLVLNRDGAPLTGAHVVLQAGGNGNPGELSELSDDEGRVSFSAFPGAYSHRASLDGYCNVTGASQIAESDSDNAELRIVLHRTIDARLHVAWSSTSFHQGAAPGAASAGDEVVELSAPGRSSSPAASASPVRVVQEEDRIVVQLESFPFYAPGAPGVVAPWLKKQPAPAESENAGDDPQARFDAVKLSETAALGDDFESVPFQVAGPGQGQPIVRIPAKAGDLFVGQFVGRDRRTGQPLNFTIKALVTAAADEASASE